LNEKFNRIETFKKGVTCQMRGKGEIQNNFEKVIINAYEKGTTDSAITVQKLIEDIKVDLAKTGQFKIKTG
jgi:hypothetical protein